MSEHSYYREKDVDLHYVPITLEQEQELFRKMKAGDEDARETIIRHHLLYIVKMGRRFSGGRLPEDETTSAGNMAMLKALPRFDPARGFRFCSFLKPYVRAAIARLFIQTFGQAPPDENSYSLVQEGSVDHPYEQEEHESYLKEKLLACADKLSPKDRELVHLHYVQGFNFAEIGRRRKVSREAIRTAHDKILGTLKDLMKKEGITEL